MKICRTILVALSTLVILSAHDIITTNLTYTRDISRIFVRRCQSCHSADASIPLTTYEQVRPWAVSIKEQVLSRQMPPWGAVKGFGHLAPDHGLSQEEIMIIAAWVVGGAPNGNPAFLPTPAMAGSSAILPVLKDALMVTNQSRIETPLTIAGIRPLTGKAIESARITATFPDGHVEPLLWLFHYNPAWQETFRFREKITLPSGAIVESASPLQFALETN
jgi:hypothetical protein